MAHSEGFEPPTLGSEDRCSIQLSYECVSEKLALMFWADKSALLTRFSTKPRGSSGDSGGYVNKGKGQR